MTPGYPQSAAEISSLGGKEGPGKSELELEGNLFSRGRGRGTGERAAQHVQGHHREMKMGVKST